MIPTWYNKELQVSLYQSKTYPLYFSIATRPNHTIHVFAIYSASLG